MNYGLPLGVQVHNPDNVSEEDLTENGLYRGVSYDEYGNIPVEHLQVCFAGTWSRAKTHVMVKTWTYRVSSNLPMYVHPQIHIQESLVPSVEPCVEARKAGWKPTTEQPNREEADSVGIVTVLLEDGCTELRKIAHWPWNNSDKAVLMYATVPKVETPIRKLIREKGLTEEDIALILKERKHE